MIQVYNNFFSPAMYQRMIDDSYVGWRLDRYRIEKDLTNKFYTEDCITQMQKVFEKKVSLYRAYSNGDTLAPRYLHRDKNSTHTAILFLNEDYDPDWMGGTVIYDNDQMNYVGFYPNRLVLFDAHLEHIGTNFQNTPNMRLINVWKINIDAF